MRGVYVVALIVFLIVILLLLHPFDRGRVGEIRVGFAGYNVPGHIAYTYTIFSGVESRILQASRGENISLSFNATVRRGTLHIRVIDPEENLLWAVSLNHSQRGDVEIPVRASGIHRVVIEGDETSGGFEVLWHTS